MPGWHAGRESVGTGDTVTVRSVRTRWADSSSTASSTSSSYKRWHAFALKHFLPLGLLLAILLGLTLPQLGTAAASLKVGEWGVVQTFAICNIFIVTGLTLKTDDLMQAIRAWRATTFGIASINFLTPLLALATTRVPREFLCREFQYGFLLFCVMPTTINSGVALANAAGGNFALALLLTVATNMIAIFTSPFYLGLLLSIGGVSIDATPLFGKLLLTLLLPLLAGKVAREASTRVLAFVKAHKTLLSNSSALCLITVPWMKLSVSQRTLVSLDAPQLAALLVCALLIHFIYLALNYTAALYVLRLPLEMRKSVVIMCSQKTLPMAMTLLSFFPETLGEPGLIAIPCILSHLVQLFVDAFLAARWAKVTVDTALLNDPRGANSTGGGSTRAESGLAAAVDDDPWQLNEAAKAAKAEEDALELAGAAPMRTADLGGGKLGLEANGSASKAVQGGAVGKL